jgi:GTP-dependent dephospho-CoA kinase
VTTTDNQAGTIERRAAGVIRRSIGSYLLTSKMQVILVNGEEDLMTIPAILISPLDSLVLYGHPEKGIVIVKVTESKKKEVLSIFNKMR